MIAGLTASQFNVSVEHPTVRAATRYLARTVARFRSFSFIEAIGASGTFPLVSVGQLIAAANAAGAPLQALHLDPNELRLVEAPFLAFLRRAGAADDRTDLVPVERFGRRRVVLSEDGFAVQGMAVGEFISRWTGIVLFADRNIGEGSPLSDLDAYREDVRIVPDFISREECKALIEYCENFCFRRSRVVRLSREGLVDSVARRVRSSSSIVLDDRSHPLLRPLYQRCAGLEQVEEHNIELVQCVRYKRGQKFAPHFDGGVQLPRMTTYLLYLSDDFEGGETYFPVLDLKIRPKAGSCLRFASCDRSGRVMWQSEHGGLPVTSGTKYALNIWVRCPPADLDAGTIGEILGRLAAHTKSQVSA